MKLCPQCEFIYEDDQSACDMDGVALVFDNRTGVYADTFPLVASPTRSRLRGIAVPTIAGLLLSAVVFFAYCASTPLLRSAVAPHAKGTDKVEPQHLASENSALQPDTSPKSPDASEVASEPIQPDATEANNKPASASPKSQVSASKTKPIQTQKANPVAVPPLPLLTPLPQLPAPKRLPKAQSYSKGSGPNQKTVLINVEPPPAKAGKRAKVGGFLKKTARLLKKPFKF
jgi:hypothetical protein